MHGNKKNLNYDEIKEKLKENNLPNSCDRCLGRLWTGEGCFCYLCWASRRRELFQVVCFCVCGSEWEDDNPLDLRMPQKFRVDFFFFFKMR